MPDTFEDARRYIGRVMALPKFGEEEFIGIINTYEPPNHKGKLPFSAGVIASDQHAAVDQIEVLLRPKGNNRDIYICLGTLKGYRQINGKFGIRYAPDRHRDNVLRLKSLYLDVDFKGGDHGYDDEASARVALEAFYTASGLPEPNVVVHSGGGFHIYWVLDVPLSRDDWQPIASQLVEATRVHGLKCDRAVTVDACRILRVPETFNYKTKPPRPVVLDKWVDGDYPTSLLAGILAKYPSAPSHVIPRITSDFSALNGATPFVSDQDDALGEGIDVGAPPVDVRHVIRECGFIEDALKTGGASNDNTLWVYTTHLATFMEKGRELAHMMADQHPDYAADKTDELFDRKLTDKERGIGWLKCSTIKNGGATQCLSCPHASKDLYPFSFAKNPNATALSTYVASAPFALPANDELPDGYGRNKLGQIYKLDKGEEQYEIIPTKSVIYDAHFSLHNSAILNFTAKVSEFTEPRLVALKNSSLYGGTSWLEALADVGVNINDSEELRSLLVAWVEKLRANRRSHSDHSAFGWASKNGVIVGFAHNQVLFEPDGQTKTALCTDTEISRQFSVLGDIEVWKHAASLVTATKRPGIDAILASSFAGPLIQFTGEKGIYINVYSEHSGVGKTTAMRTAQAVWGNPNLAMNGVNDTRDSVLKKIGTLRNLTCFWDELKSAESMKAMAKMVYSLTGGRGKSRLTSSIEQRHVDDWQTMLVSASNDSLEEPFNEEAKGNTAGFLRLFELEVRDFYTGILTMAEGSDINRMVDTNYGAAGMLYAQWLGENIPQIEQDVRTYQNEVQKILNAAPSERFWVNVVVVLALGARYANQLGLTNINIKELVKALIGQINVMRETLITSPLEASNPDAASALLAQYLVDKQRWTMKTVMIWDQAGHPPSGGIRIIHPRNILDHSTRDAFHIQFGQTDKKLRFSRKHFEDWLETKNIASVTKVLRTLEQSFGMKYCRKVIGHGTPAATIRMPVYDVDLAHHADLASLMDGLASDGNVIAMNPKP